MHCDGDRQLSREGFPHMKPLNLTLSFITDEVSPHLETGLKFAQAEDVSAIDLRVIDDRNAIELSRDELIHAAKLVRSYGMTVACVCTPLLKWSPLGRFASAKGDQFGFELGDRAPDSVYIQAFEAAEILGAHDLRIFSYLAYDDFRLQDLRQPLDLLLTLAEKFDMKLHVENEVVCNVVDLSQLYTLIADYEHPRLRVLPDIANAYRAGIMPTANDVARLLPYADILHLKDYSEALGRFVAVGEGDIPLEAMLAATLPGHPAPLTLTIETHASVEPEDTTRRSIRGLRRMLNELKDSYAGSQR
jgi:sugar phosphate isomerase/epimerase